MPTTAARKAAPPVIRRAEAWSTDLANLDPARASRLRDLVQRAYHSGKREAYSSVLAVGRGEHVSQAWVRDRMYEVENDLRQTEERLRREGGMP